MCRAWPHLVRQRELLQEEVALETPTQAREVTHDAATVTDKGSTLQANDTTNKAKFNAMCAEVAQKVAAAPDGDHNTMVSEARSQHLGL